MTDWTVKSTRKYFTVDRFIETAYSFWQIFWILKMLDMKMNG